MQKWKLGINDNPGYDLPLADRLSMIRGVGFDAVFTGWSEGCPIETWADQIAKEGLIYQSVHAPFNKISSLWKDAGDAGEAYTDLLIRCVEDAARVSVPLVIIHPYIGFDIPQPGELGLKRYARLIDAAEKHGVQLGFENVEGLVCLDAILNRFSDRDAVGFCWDTGHEMCYNFSEDLMAKYGNRLVGTHFNDNLGMEDPQKVTWLDDLHVLPFDGIADWKGIMERIVRSGYQGILTFELTVCNKPGKHTHDEYAKWEPEQFFAEAYARAQKIINLIK